MTDTIETEFLQDNAEHGRSIMSLGTPNSGKSYLALKYLVWALNNNIYDEIHLIAPMIHAEENDSYGFLKQYSKKVFLYQKYHEVVAKKIDKLRESKKIMFMIDDATCELLNNIDNTFIKLWTTTRHSKSGGLTFWVIAHSGKRVLPPMIRQNIKYIFLYSIESAELLDDTIFKEFVSLQYFNEGKKFKDFVKDYMTSMKKHKFGCILIARKMGIDWDVPSWNLYNQRAKTAKKEVKEIKQPEIKRGFPFSISIAQMPKLKY